MVCKSVEEVLKRNKSSDLEVSGQALIIGAAARAFLRRRQILRSYAKRAGETFVRGLTLVMKQTPRRPLTSELTLLKTSNFFVGKQMYVLQR